MSLTIKEDVHMLDQMKEALDYLVHTEVGVGIPPENDHHSGPFSASELLYLHESGCPVNRVPPRPVMDPALSDGDVQQSMADALLEALEAALQGSIEGAQAGLEKAGQTGADALKNYIMDGGHLAANAPITVSGGWMRNHKSGKPVFIHGKGGATPLLDTGQLVNAFGYKIKEK